MYRLALIFSLSVFLFSCQTAVKKSRLGKAPDPAQQMLKQARKEFKNRQWRDAEETLTQLIRKYRSTDAGDDGLFLLAKIYSRQELWKRAFNVYQSVYDSDIYSPREFLARTAAAKILTYKVSRPKKALDLIDESLGLSPKPVQRADLLEVRFDALMKTGSQLEAFETLIVLSTKHPVKSKRLDFRRKAKTFLDSRLSGPDLKDFADDSPESQLKIDAQFRYGVLMMEEGNYSEAKSYLRDVINSSPRTYLAEQSKQLISQMDANDKVSTRTVGVVLPLSGRYSAIGYQALYGVQLSLGIKGGRNKNNIRLVVMDSQGKPEYARKGVKRLVQENQAIAIVGGLTSKTAYAAAIQAQELGVPFVGLSQREGLTDIGPFIFRNALTVETQINSLVRTAMEELKVKRFAVLYPNDSYGTKLTKIFWQTVRDNGGEVTAAQSYLPGETDFKETVQKLVGTFYVEDRQKEYEKRLEEWYEKQGSARRRLKPPIGILPPIVDFEAIFVPDGPKAVGQIAPMLAYNDISKVYLIGTNIWNTKEFLRRGQSFVSQSLFTDTLYENDQRFLDSQFYKTYSKTFGRAPSTFSLQGYDSGLIIRAVLERGATSRIEFANEIKRHSGIPGAISDLILNRKKEFVRPVVTLTVKEGEIRPFTVE